MIYFIQSGDEGAVKIGRAYDPAMRLRELQTGNPEHLHLRAVVNAPDAAEKHLHLTLELARLRGEWFDGQEMIVNIAMACAMAGHIWNPHCAGCGSGTD